MKSFFRILAPALCALALSPSAFSAPMVALDGYRVVPIKNGITPFDFGTHGGKAAARKLAGYIVVSHRENFNAHGFDVISFHAYEPGEQPKTLGLISIFPEGDKERYNVSVSGGADCVLHDFRLLESVRGKPALLVVADRDPGDTFVDPATVSFHYYKLNENTDGTPGEPHLYFKHVDAGKSKRNYCEVGEAFKAELGLGPYEPPQN